MALAGRHCRKDERKELSNLLILPETTVVGFGGGSKVSSDGEGSLSKSERKVAKRRSVAADATSNRKPMATILKILLHLKTCAERRVQQNFWSLQTIAAKRRPFWSDEWSCPKSPQCLCPS
jgi:hypothetical protein